MIRSLIKIDEEKCNGCGLCADACHEGAIEMIDGKAKQTAAVTLFFVYFNKASYHNFSPCLLNF